MKITQSKKATKQNITYMQNDLINLLNEIYEHNEQSRENAQQNIQNVATSINYDFDVMRKTEYVENDKKWRKGKIIAGISGVAGFVGLVAAGAITQGAAVYLSSGKVTSTQPSGATAVGVAWSAASAADRHCSPDQLPDCHLTGRGISGRPSVLFCCQPGTPLDPSRRCGCNCIGTSDLYWIRFPLPEKSQCPSCKIFCPVS